MFVKYLPVFVFFALVVGITLEIAGPGITANVVLENPPLSAELTEPIGPSWHYESEGDAAILMQNGQFSIEFLDVSGRDILYYPNVEFEDGEVYELSFMAASNTEDNIIVNIADETVHWSRRVPLNEEFSNYVYEVRPGVSGFANLNFYFSPGNGRGSSYVISDVVLRKISENLLRSGSFEQNVGDWQAISNGNAVFRRASDSVTHGKYAEEIRIIEGGTDVRLYQEGIPIESGEKYFLSFDAKSSGEDSVLVHVHGNSVWQELGLANELVRLTSVWKRYGIEFTSTSEIDRFATLTFELSPFDQRGDVFYFDRVTLEKIS